MVFTLSLDGQARVLRSSVLVELVAEIAVSSLWLLLVWRHRLSARLLYGDRPRNMEGPCTPRGRRASPACSKKHGDVLPPSVVHLPWCVVWWRVADECFRHIEGP